MKRTILAVALGTMLFPAGSFAHDRGAPDPYDRGLYRATRDPQPGDPGYYCHRHKRKTSDNDTGRRHCHSVYNDEHNPDAWRDYRDYRSSRDRGWWGWWGN